MTDLHTSAAPPGTPATDVYGPLLQQALQHSLDYFAGLPGRPVKALATDDELHRLLGGPVPDDPAAPEDVLTQLVSGVDRGLVPTGNGRYLGYVVGGTLPVAMAADWLTSAWDQNCIVHDISPATSVVEEICAAWLIDLFGLPARTSAAFVPACTHAELLCLAAARHKVLAQHGWNVAERGMRGAPEVAVLINGEAHTAVVRSLEILGLGGSIRRIAVDAEARMLPAALDAALNETAGMPLIVSGQVGEINTGGIDHLRMLCDKTHAVGGWVHLDAAFGMWAAASPTLRRNVADGIELADSWATDAHKWLNTPYDGGVAMIADPDAHRAALPLDAGYLQLQPDQRHPVEWGLEVSRRSRVFPIWAALRQLGRSGVADLVDRCCAHALRIAQTLSAVEGIEVLNDVTLNQVTVRFTPASGPDGSDAHTLRVVERFQQLGESWASPSRWQDRTVLRLCLINWATTEADIDRAAASLIQCHRELRDAPLQA
ncbi:pyridoxal phosphate-dependent decarboxylase family protein [Streptomyces beijiangensis]|uniref:Aspartate aminotransferase family protein n=1 Tax=Streptomyces beijiangensis TaxID=163361 RepID=A0A939F440_9ACTN|nr:pyridoxal-dependent decarboxylase [Streptomyces beijiangensis]MBO0511915.1 aspartate aminotransferase family protein [Streptomyces beijiangensis]